MLGGLWSDLTGLGGGTGVWGNIGGLSGGGGLSPSGGVTPPPEPVTGDVIGLTIVGGTVTTDSGFSPRLNGACAILRIKNMGRRNDFTDPVAVVSSLTLTVTDPGFDAPEVTATRTRTIRGTLPLRDTWPAAWSSLPSSVAANSWCSNGLNQYYTAAGGTRGAVAPTGTGTFTDGTITWQYYDATVVAGYTEKVVGDDVDVYIMLDDAIYQGSTITAASFGAGGYVVGAVSNRASAAIPNVVNASLLPYEIPVASYLSVPHERAVGTITPELVIGHSRMGSVPGKVGAVAGVRARAWDMARTTSVTGDATAPSLSTLVTTASPGGAAVEVYAPAITLTGLPQGDAFVEVTIYPWLGVKWETQLEGEAANWLGGTNYPYVGLVRRNGNNLYITTTAGVSASSGGPTGTGTGIIDGGAMWNYFGDGNPANIAATKQNSHNIPARWHFYNDPSNLYKIGYCCVRAAGAIGTPQIYTTEAEALTNKAINAYGTIQAAAAAMATYNSTSGGGLTTHNDPGAGRIMLLAGIHAGVGASMQSLAIPSVWLYVIADPTAAPGAVQFIVGANKVCSRRFWFGNGITTTATSGSAGNAMLDPGTDGVTTPAQPVTEVIMTRASIAGFNSTAEVVSRAGLVWYVNNTCTGGFITGSQATRAHPALVAGNSFSGDSILRGMSMFGNLVYGVASSATVSIQDARASGKPAGMFLALTDNYVSGLPSSTSKRVTIYTGAVGTDWARLGGYSSGNLIESTNKVTVDKCIEAAADGSLVGVSWVDAQGVQRGGFVEAYNSYVGQRRNGPYNDQSSSTLSAQWYSVGNLSLTDNIIEGSDDHAPGGRSGSRCQNWWADYRVGYRNNVNFAGSETGPLFNPSTAAGNRAGLNSKWNIVPVLANIPAQFVNDASVTGTGLGNGDYHPTVIAQALDMSTVAGRRYALDGAVRLTNGTGAIGAYERL